MIFTISNKTDTSAKGKVDYDCEYIKDGKKLLGKKGTWRAEKSDVMESEKVREASTKAPKLYKSIKIKINSKKGKKKTTKKPSKKSKGDYSGYEYQYEYF